MYKYNKGDVVTGIVTGIENYGIFLSLDDDYNGLIHISEISSLFVKNVGDYAKIGDKLEVKVLEVNEDDKQLKLSIKEIEYHAYNKRLHPIEETPNGFCLLKDNLNVWIRQKLDEINEKN